jgi:hypothetical protein
MKGTLSYQEYRKNPAISPSDIKLFATDPRKFYKIKFLGEEFKEKKSRALVIGNISDLILTQIDQINQLYYIVAEWKATEKVKEITDLVFNEINKLPEFREFANNLHLIEEAINKVGFYPNWGMSKRIETVIEKGKAYFEQLQEASGREVITAEIYGKAAFTVEKARLNKDMADFISLVEGRLEVPTIEVEKQVELFGTCRGTLIKGLLDLGIKDTLNKTYQPIDIKTCKYLQNFPINAKLSRYDIQGDMYHYMLQERAGIIKDPLYGYNILPFKFLVLPVEGEHQPEWFQFTPEDMIVARLGVTINEDKRIFGWTESLGDISWHLTNDKWDHHRLYYENENLNILNLWNSGSDSSISTSSDEEDTSFD